jgi:hypothetical protein
MITHLFRQRLRVCSVKSLRVCPSTGAGASIYVGYRQERYWGAACFFSAGQTFFVGTGVEVMTMMMMMMMMMVMMMMMMMNPGGVL